MGVVRSLGIRQPSRPVSRTPGNPVPARRSVSAQPPVNVVAGHRQRNRTPRLPSNMQLLAARQQQAESTDDATGDTEAATGNGNGQARPANPGRSAMERAEPWQLQYYDPPTRDVIDRAKQFSHCDAASINPFPIRTTFDTKVVEYIDEAITERRARGLIISDGK